MEISAELVERCVAFVREVGRLTADSDMLVGRADVHDEARLADEARAIVAELPVPIDPDLLLARTIAVKHALPGRYNTTSTYMVGQGAADDHEYMVAIVEAIKRGRELAALARSAQS